MEEKKIELEEALAFSAKHGRKVTKQTIYNWIRDYHIGKKVAGRYLIIEGELKKLLEGELKKNG
jgi:hypothetical protein